MNLGVPQAVEHQGQSQNNPQIEVVAQEENITDQNMI